MAMRDYPIQGYGIGIKWEDKETFKKIIDAYKLNDFVRVEFDPETEKATKEYLMDEFFYDTQDVAEVLTELMNEEIYKKYPRENYGIGYETANDEYFYILFHDVRYGMKPDMTIDEVEEAVENIVMKIFDIPKNTSRSKVVEITQDHGVIYGNIFDSYYA